MSYHPISAAGARAAGRPSGEGLFARMIRLWLEHHQRVADFGGRPL